MLQQRSFRADCAMRASPRVRCLAPWVTTPDPAFTAANTAMRTNADRFGWAVAMKSRASRLAPRARPSPGPHRRVAQRNSRCASSRRKTLQLLKATEAFSQVERWLSPLPAEPKPSLSKACTAHARSGDTGLHSGRSTTHDSGPYWRKNRRLNFASNPLRSPIRSEPLKTTSRHEAMRLSSTG